MNKSVGADPGSGGDNNISPPDMAKNHLIYKWLYILDGSDALPDPVRVSTIICKF